MNLQEKASTLPQGSGVMDWKIKTLASSPREALQK